MAIPYEAEIERLAAHVESGADLYRLASESEYTTDETLFRDAMDATMFPDAYINMAQGPVCRDRVVLLANTVVFFALCADVRWCVAERAGVDPVRVTKPTRRKGKRANAKRARRVVKIDEN
jgi:hypothetical protein